MLTRDDVIDVIMAGLAPKGSPVVSARGQAGPKLNNSRPDALKSAEFGKSFPGPRGRLFLSEYDIKKRLTAGSARLTLPEDCIVSPLALEWLSLRGIEIIRQ